MTWRIIQADVLAGLAQLPDGSVQTVVTSPPYWGLRDYGTATWEGGDAACDHTERMARQDHERETPGGRGGSFAETPIGYRDRCGKCQAVRIDAQLGLEPTPEAYVERLVAVFREVRRVLRRDGTVWLNLGDSYAANPWNGRSEGSSDGAVGRGETPSSRVRPSTLKPKDLVGIPWRVAFALQADGWYLRSDIIWSKPNPMPESVTDRPTKAHEYVFLLTRSPRYFYDADAVREEAASVWNPAKAWAARMDGTAPELAMGADRERMRTRGYGTHHADEDRTARNLRSVWSIPTEPFPEAHFATFPKALVVPCVKAGTSEKGCCPECGAAWVRQVERDGSEPYRTGKSAEKAAVGLVTAFSGYADGSWAPTFRTVGWAPSCSHVAEPVPCTVLDPFAGSGTVGVVALRHGRSFVGVELNPDYAEMARNRIRDDGPLWNIDAEVTA